MSNRREIEPSLDYFELRRRHEEYKNSQKPKDGAEPEPVALAEPAMTEAPVMVAEPAPVAEPAETAASVPVTEEPAPATEAETVTVEDVAPGAEDAPGGLNLSDTLEDRVPADMDDAALVDDEMPRDEADDGNPNPFDSFIHAFRGIRSKLSGRFGRRGQADEEYDDELPEDDLPVDTLPQDDGASDETPVRAADAPETRPAPPADADHGSVEDVLEDAPAAPVAQRRDAGVAAPEDEVTGDEGDYDEDEDYEEDGGQERVGRFKKFLRLFVVPISEEEADAYAPEDEDYPDGDENDAAAEADGMPAEADAAWKRSEEHTSELQSRE